MLVWWFIKSNTYVKGISLLQRIADLPHCGRREREPVMGTLPTLLKSGFLFHHATARRYSELSSEGSVLFCAYMFHFYITDRHLKTQCRNNLKFSVAFSPSVCYNETHKNNYVKMTDTKSERRTIWKLKETFCLIRDPPPQQIR